MYFFSINEIKQNQLLFFFIFFDFLLKNNILLVIKIDFF